MLRVFLDTNVLVAALRCQTGASRLWLRGALDGQFSMLATPTVFLEYEAVLKREEHLKASGALASTIDEILNALAIVVEPVEVSYLWRPQLKDPADEMILEAAVNGRADWIVTFNLKHFVELADRFGMKAVTPGEGLNEIRRKHETK